MKKFFFFRVLDLYTYNLFVYFSTEYSDSMAFVLFTHYKRNGKIRQRKIRQNTTEPKSNTTEKSNNKKLSNKVSRKTSDNVYPRGSRKRNTVSKLIQKEKWYSFLILFFSGATCDGWCRCYTALLLLLLWFIFWAHKTHSREKQKNKFTFLSSLAPINVPCTEFIRFTFMILLEKESGMHLFCTGMLSSFGFGSFQYKSYYRLVLHFTLPLFAISSLVWVLVVAFLMCWIYYCHFG